MTQQGYYQQPPPQKPPPQYQQQYQPPEASSIKSMVNIASIFGILLAVLFILIALWGIFVWMTVDTYTDWYGYTYTEPVTAITWFYIGFGLLGLIFGILFFMMCRGINQLVDQGQYVQAKSKTLVWMIIGIIFVGFIPGI